MKKIIFFDCETTGLPPKMNWETHFEFFPFVVQLAWIADDKEKNYIIKPRGYNIPLYTTNIHGISTEKALAEGSYFEDIIEEFLDDCSQADLICAHNIYFDTSIIKANILRYMGKEFYLSKADQALHKTKRIDTMRKTIDFVGALNKNGKPGKLPSLQELYTKCFPDETFKGHDALEDARALKECYHELLNKGILT